ncbi:hypothetical protein HBI56_231930 [Parastagonospora nodorum]|nr:hypothetical protein HBH53_238890 [Parastagonospora nodorum]KAH3957157.1 hypothetical protein HBH51_229440 [Parastagonospora nodorum]KAH3993599.1 hypothetical protein HBI10_200430 [Parastagonospora nodorum]KAH4012194.1 hypothetical protein HBI13_189720 [Parastagonospora nodorum]KAH4042984.1 hypothetical protein HBH49_240260 [Parastagonospora nodorum]
MQTTPAPTTSTAALSTISVEKAMENFEMIHPTELKVEDDYGVALTRTSVANYLLRRLHGNKHSACYIARKCPQCSSTIAAIELLFTCSDLWNDPTKTPVKSLDCILYYTNNMLIDTDWAEKDKALVEAGDFEVSAVIWALQIGPRGLANGIAGGVGVLQILMDVEQEWMLDHVDDDDFASQVQALRDFAEGLCDWGKRVGQGGKEGYVRFEVFGWGRMSRDE